jgi:hypothetical protein
VNKASGVKLIEEGQKLPRRKASPEPYGEN